MCKQCEEVANILDELYKPIARAIDSGQEVSMDDVNPMSRCMGRLMDVWMKLRPGNSNVGIVRAVLENKRTQG